MRIGRNKLVPTDYMGTESQIALHTREDSMTEQRLRSINHQAAPMSPFVGMLEQHWQHDNFVCVGLDSDYSYLPAGVKAKGSIEEALFVFNREIIDATHDLVCAYKPNSAFYEAQGDE